MGALWLQSLITLTFERFGAFFCRLFYCIVTIFSYFWPLPIPFTWALCFIWNMVCLVVEIWEDLHLKVLVHFSAVFFIAWLFFFKLSSLVHLLFGFHKKAVLCLDWPGMGFGLLFSFKSFGAFFCRLWFCRCFRIPLLFMELAVGQYTRRGPIGAIEKMCPILKGKFNNAARLINYYWNENESLKIVELMSALLLKSKKIFVACGSNLWTIFIFFILKLHLKFLIRLIKKV